jgi:hypothetical protein
MGVHLVNSLYEYVMITEEDDRRKQLSKIERLKKQTNKLERKAKKGKGKGMTSAKD